MNRADSTVMFTKSRLGHSLHACGVSTPPSENWAHQISLILHLLWPPCLVRSFLEGSSNTEGWLNTNLLLN